MVLHGNVTSTSASFAFGGAAHGIDAIKRAVGCMMILKLSTAGMDEAWQSLVDIWEFHAPKEAASFPHFVSAALQGRALPPSERLPLLIDDSGE